MGTLVDSIFAELQETWDEGKWAEYYQFQAAFDFKKQQTEFGALIRSTREAAGISQRRLAKIANIQQRELSKIETAQGNPTAQTRFRLLNALGLRETFTVTRRDRPQPAGGKTRAKKAQTQSIIA